MKSKLIEYLFWHLLSRLFCISIVCEYIRFYKDITVHLRPLICIRVYPGPRRNKRSHDKSKLVPLHPWNTVSRSSGTRAAENSGKNRRWNIWNRCPRYVSLFRRTAPVGFTCAKRPINPAKYPELLDEFSCSILVFYSIPAPSSTISAFVSTNHPPCFSRRIQLSETSSALISRGKGEKTLFENFSPRAKR